MMTTIRWSWGVAGLSALALVSGCADQRACAEYGEEGCICRMEPADSDVEFAGTCDESGVGERGVCCQGDDYCRCEPVRCGISAINGNCACGVGLFLSSIVGSCDGTASTCCTQNTGYCYCEDGCQDRFANRTVFSCNAATETATCRDGELRVASCQ